MSESSPLIASPASYLPESGSISSGGLTQRIQALNLFLADVYGKGHILRDGTVPRDLVQGCPNYRPEMEGVQVPLGAYVSVCGE